MPSSISSSDTAGSQAPPAAFVPVRLTASDRPGVAQPVPVRDIPRFISLYQQGRLPVDRMVSRRVGLDELNEGFDRLQAVATVRQLLVPHG